MTTKKLNISDSITPTSGSSAEVSVGTKDRKSIGKEKLEKYMKEELKTVKGIFQFFECPGMSQKIIIRKYPGHFFEKEMTDGQEYEIPLYVARHLNGIDITAEAIDGKLGTCGYKIHEYLMDKNGIPIVVTNKTKRRFGFQSMQFAGTAVA